MTRLRLAAGAKVWRVEFCMSRSLIYLVAGARPNFMKIAPIVRALQARADRFEFKHHPHRPALRPGDERRLLR
jgi:hypothetical protein